MWPNPPKPPLPAGTFTVGGKFSNHLQSGFLDATVPFAQAGNVTFFGALRGTWDDNHQLLLSTGLGARYLVPGHDIIIGGNVFYDYIDSQRDRLILVMDSFAKARCNAPMRQVRKKVPDDHEIAYYHCISRNNQSVPGSVMEWNVRLFMRHQVYHVHCASQPDSCGCLRIGFFYRQGTMRPARKQGVFRSAHFVSASTLFAVESISILIALCAVLCAFSISGI